MPKPPGVVRIAFLGSSTTLDAYVAPLEETWPHRISDALQQAFPEVEVDYVNAGVPGMGSASMVTYYEHFVKQVSPDIVVILANDLNRDMDDLARESGIHDGVHYRPSWLATHSLFWAQVEKNAVIIRLQRAALDPAVDTRHQTGVGFETTPLGFVPATYDFRRASQTGPDLENAPSDMRSNHAGPICLPIECVGENLVFSFHVVHCRGGFRRHVHIAHPIRGVHLLPRRSRGNGARVWRSL